MGDPSGEPEAVRGSGGTRRSAAAQARSADRALRVPLLVLGAVFGVTFLCWGTAHVACNRQVPQLKAADPQPLDRATSNPKSVAILVQQRSFEHDYDTALKLATGALGEQLRQEQSSCQATPGGCQKVAGVVTHGVLMSNTGRQATARVTTEVAGQAHQFEVSLERQDRRWTAIERQAL